MEDIDKLVEQIKAYNEAYRRGEPIISDQQYDDLVEKLRQADPSHPFLLEVEPEKFEGRKEVRHPVPMLSIEKAYDEEQLKRFINWVIKEAAEIDVRDVLFKVTVKLDGLAGRDDGQIFATRGNGEAGYEISSAFTKGLIPIGGRGQGLGEIVVVKSYFDANMSGKFEHPRNMVVGIISSDVLNEHAEKALKEGMVHFVPYAQMPSWIGPGDELRLRFDATGLPHLPDGWVRDFIFFAEGWVKDGDLNTKFSATVEPLPFHGMSGYPYSDTERYPDSPALENYRREFNTRPGVATVGRLPAVNRCGGR